MLIVILLLKLVAALAAIKNNLKVIGYFLLGNLSLDVIAQVIKHFQHYPKPYTGIAFVLYAIGAFCYLANGAWLMFCAGWTLKNTTLKQVSVLALLSMITFVLLIYPTLCGMSMLMTWYAFYGALSLVSVVVLLKDMRKHLTWSSGVMLMLSLGCIADLALVILFGFPYYWLVSVSNVLFYLAVLGVCWLIPRYRNLLTP